MTMQSLSSSSFSLSRRSCSFRWVTFTWCFGSCTSSSLLLLSLSSSLYAPVHPEACRLISCGRYLRKHTGQATSSVGTGPL